VEVTLTVVASISTVTRPWRKDHWENLTGGLEESGFFQAIIWLRVLLICDHSLQIGEQSTAEAAK
jgi:hypothetical protein